uniref:L27 domain-containing protein n=1 Tax=Branchiostoma floridae TaxID=7739 RepID=C3YXG9_BRAFL|eukprot:XP_002598766.1 hypothetical protein BRAFLDRAFT_74556 [Branchiostoma floridae]
MPVRKQDAHRALELLEDYHAKLTKPGDRQLRAAIERVIRIFKSRLFQALLDIQEFYEVTLQDGTKTTDQKTRETMEIANKWEEHAPLTSRKPTELARQKAAAPPPRPVPPQHYQPVQPVQTVQVADVAATAPPIAVARQPVAMAPPPVKKPPPLQFDVEKPVVMAPVAASAPPASAPVQHVLLVWFAFLKIDGDELRGDEAVLGGTRSRESAHVVAMVTSSHIYMGIGGISIFRVCLSRDAGLARSDCRVGRDVRGSRGTYVGRLGPTLPGEGLLNVGCISTLQSTGSREASAHTDTLEGVAGPLSAANTSVFLLSAGG